MSLSSIMNRVSNQFRRIDEGLKSNTLSAGEAKGLAGKDLRILGQAATDAAQNGGKLTADDRQQLRHELNHNSRDIFEDKHPHSVAARLDRQQHRITEGVKSGKLTTDQAKELAATDKQIRAEARTDRAANGGKLTDAQRAQLQQELNASSKAIFEAKHPNVVPQPPVTQG